MLQESAAVAGKRHARPMTCQPEAALPENPPHGQCLTTYAAGTMWVPGHHNNSTII